MNRRRFLAAGAAALSAAAAPRLLAGARAVPAPRLVLHLAPLRDDLARDLDGTLAAVAASGVAAVELFSPYLYAARRPGELRAALDRAGLAAAGVHVGTSLLYRGWERHVESAGTLGCRWVVCAGMNAEERRTARDWRELAAVFGRAGAAARAAGLRFGYLVHGFELAPVERVVPLEVLLRETDPALVGLELDLAGVASRGASPPAVLARAAGRVLALHVAGREAPPSDVERAMTWAGAAGVADVVVERANGGS